jgi:hypothetical protein
MSFAPQQNWRVYAERTATEQAHWVRALSLSERFDLYADLFNVIWNARQNAGMGDWDRLDQWSWEQKLARRQREVAAFRKRDELRNG